MKPFLMLALSGATALAVDNDIRVITTSTTNATTSSLVHTQDIFTRNGQTNLIRITDSKAGAVQLQIHRFYHDGQWIGNYGTTPDSSDSVVGAGTAYSITFVFGPAKDPRTAVIGAKDGSVVDAFVGTNGIFVPVESSLIKTYPAGLPEMDQAIRQWQDQWNGVSDK